MKRLNVTQVVEEVVSLENWRREAFERIRHLLEQPKVQLGGARPSRDDLHER